METPESKNAKYRQEEMNVSDVLKKDESEDVDVEGINTPPDKKDLEENNFTEKETGQVISNPPPKGSSGKEEKDITD